MPSFDVGRDVVDEPAHAVVVVAEDLRIAVPDVVMPGQQHAGRAPLDRPVERAGKTRARIGRRDGQDAPGGLLGIADVAGDLGEPVAAVVAIAERRREQVGALQPAELLAVRAVGHHVGHVRAHGPVDEPVRVVVERAGGRELADLGQVGAHVDQLRCAG